MSLCALRTVQRSLQTPTTEEYAPLPPIGTMRAHVVEKGRAGRERTGPGEPMNRAGDWSCDVDTAAGVSSILMSGLITATDIMAAQDRLAGDTRFDPTFPLIVDLRHASDLPLTWLQARSIALRSPVYAVAPRAFVAHTIVGAAMAYAYRAVRATLTGADVVHVFGSMDQAHGWLTSDRRTTRPRSH